MQISKKRNAKLYKAVLQAHDNLMELAKHIPLQVNSGVWSLPWTTYNNLSLEDQLAKALYNENDALVNQINLLPVYARIDTSLTAMRNAMEGNIMVEEKQTPQKFFVFHYNMFDTAIKELVVYIFSSSYTMEYYVLEAESFQESKATFYHIISEILKAAYIIESIMKKT